MIGASLVPKLPLSLLQLPQAPQAARQALGGPAAGSPAANNSAAGNSAAGNSAAGNPVAGNPVAGGANEQEPALARQAQGQQVSKDQAAGAQTRSVQGQNGRAITAGPGAASAGVLHPDGTGEPCRTAVTSAALPRTDVPPAPATPRPATLQQRVSQLIATVPTAVITNGGPVAILSRADVPSPEPEVRAEADDAPQELLLGLVTMDGADEHATVLTDRGRLQLQTTLPPGARVELAVRGDQATLISLTPPPGPAHRHAPVTAARTTAADDDILPLDHRLGTALAALGEALLTDSSRPEAQTQGAALPQLLWFGTPEQTLPLRLEMVPLEDEEGGGQRKRRRGVRFRLGVRLGFCGALQLDGLLRPKRFDLRIRTERPLGGTLEADLATVFQSALEAGGLAGCILFGGSPDRWDKTHALLSPMTA